MDAQPDTRAHTCGNGHALPILAPVVARVRTSARLVVAALIRVAQPVPVAAHFALAAVLALTEVVRGRGRLEDALAVRGSQK